MRSRYDNGYDYEYNGRYVISIFSNTLLLGNIRVYFVTIRDKFFNLTLTMRAKDFERHCIFNPENALMYWTKGGRVELKMSSKSGPVMQSEWGDKI